jgi:ADP-heptose:LPS heptosyltransferase
MPVARLIATAPTDDPERTLLLFCPEQGGWQTGLFFEGRWLDFATLTLELEPTYWLPEPPEPDEAERQGRLAQRIEPRASDPKGAGSSPAVGARPATAKAAQQR